jgi:hypothetical protein
MSEKAKSGKITWGALLEAAKAAGIDPNDPVDNIDIAWGDASNLRCVRDDDFGWQISLCDECEGESSCGTD